MLTPAQMAKAHTTMNLALCRLQPMRHLAPILFAIALAAPALAPQSIEELKLKQAAILPRRRRPGEARLSAGLRHPQLSHRRE